MKYYTYIALHLIINVITNVKFTFFEKRTYAQFRQSTFRQVVKVHGLIAWSREHAASLLD